jgi:hypothetical protein
VADVFSTNENVSFSAKHQCKHKSRAYIKRFNGSIFSPTVKECRQISSDCVAGLPDGLFSNQKSQFWVNFGGSCYGKSWYIL